jgi:hypothetical protein
VIFTARQFRAIDYYLKQNGLRLELQQRTTPKTVYMTEKATGKSSRRKSKRSSGHMTAAAKRLLENAPASAGRKRPRQDDERHPNPHALPIRRMKARGVNLDWYDRRRRPRLDGNIHWRTSAAHG